MNGRLHFMVAFVFEIAAPQMLKYSIGTDSSLILNWQTVDVGSTIVFTLDTDNKGGCSSTSTCNIGIPGYLKPTQEITITEMVISSCNETRDTGNWTCTYGVSTSPVVIIADCSGVATTEDPSTTQHDVTTERILTTANGSTTTIQNTDTICTTPICISIAVLLSLRYSLSFL